MKIKSSKLAKKITEVYLLGMLTVNR